MTTPRKQIASRTKRSVVLGAAIALGFGTATWAAVVPASQGSSDGGNDIEASDLDAVREAARGQSAFSVTADGREAQAEYEAAEREVLGVEDGMVPVAREATGQQPELKTGWVSYEGFADSSEPSPIVDDRGKVVGYWASGLGWISVERATDPSFDLAKAQAQRRGRKEDGSGVSARHEAEVDELVDEAPG